VGELAGEGVEQGLGGGARVRLGRDLERPHPLGVEEQFTVLADLGHPAPQALSALVRAPVLADVPLVLDQIGQVQRERQPVERDERPDEAARVRPASPHALREANVRLEQARLTTVCRPIHWPAGSASTCSGVVTSFSFVLIKSPSSNAV